MTWLDELVGYAHDQLDEREREALWTRGVSDEQIDLYQLGYLDGPPAIEGADAFLNKYRDTYWLNDVFVLPMTNALGQVKGVQLRHVEKHKKGYSHFAPYEDEAVSVGLAQAVPHIFETGTVWLVEGAFDLFPLQRHVPNVFPTLTNHVTQLMSRLLRRLAKVMFLAYDMDIEGRKAVARVRREQRGLFEIQDIKFPRPARLDGKGRVKDPGELWEVWGDERLGTFLQRQV